MRFHFDFRNRLTRVTTGEGEAEEEIAAYAYDAFNRRVRKVVGETTEETVWSGWRALEQYENGDLRSRRTYGRGLDEVVLLEQDLDGNGLVEMEYVPLYDETGNLVMVTRDEDAEPVERYEYTPYGTRTILVDSTPPAIEQVRVKDAEVWIEASEELLQAALDRVLADGTLRLTDLDIAEDLPLTADLPILTGRQARRRLIITTTDPPAPGANLRLILPAALMVDTFLNTATEDFALDFTWPDTDDVLFDDTAPRLEKVLVKDGHVELELTEEPDLTTTDAILIDSEPVTWELDETRYKLVTTAPIDTGAHTLEVGTGLTDLAGLPLTEPFVIPIAIDPLTPRWVVYLAPDPREVSASTINNDLGLHGLEHDPETGFVYMRNRYYDPELGRFISADPMGYVDGPTMYGFAGNTPYNSSDPMGLKRGDKELCATSSQEHCQSPPEPATVRGRHIKEQQEIAEKRGQLLDRLAKVQFELAVRRYLLSLDRDINRREELGLALRRAGISGEQTSALVNHYLGKPEGPGNAADVIHGRVGESAEFAKAMELVVTESSLAFAGFGLAGLLPEAAAGAIFVDDFARVPGGAAGRRGLGFFSRWRGGAEAFMDAQGVGRSAAARQASDSYIRQQGRRLLGSGPRPTRYLEIGDRIFVQRLELHHRFIPNRWRWIPKQIRHHRLNLQPLYSVEHALRDPDRYRFLPKWLKVAIESGGVPGL